MPSWLPTIKTIEEEMADEELRLTESRRKAADSIPRWLPSNILEEPSRANAFIPQPEIGEQPIDELPFASTAEPTITLESGQREVPEWARAAMPQTGTAQLTGTPAQKTEQTPSWWEMPKAWAERGSELIGQGLSSVPMLPKALTAVAPAFEWVHENLDKPFAAVLTSMFSPSLPWQRGESWLDHQKREYDAWQAPTYVKGVAEAAMPLWWLPWFGWASKGAKALAGGTKVARAMAAASESGKLILPAGEMLDKTLTNPDNFRRFAQWAESKPVIGNMIKTIGGPAAFIRAPVIGELPIETTKRALVKRVYLSDLGSNGGKGLLLPKLQRYGHVRNLLQIDDVGHVGAATPKPHLKISTALSDVMEKPWRYDFATPEAKKFVEETRAVLDEVYKLAAKEGVPIPKEMIFHRLVDGKAFSKEAVERMAKEQRKAVDQVLKEIGDSYEKSEFGSLFEARRHYKTMEAGIKAGVRYNIDPIKSVSATIDHYMRKIAAKRFDDEVGKLGKTVVQKISELEPNLIENMTNAAAKVGSAGYALQTLRRVTGFGGSTIPPATLAKIRKGLPDIADKIDRLLAIPIMDIDNALGNLSKEFWQAAKMTPTEFKVTLAKIHEINKAFRPLGTEDRILYSEIDDTIRSLNMDKFKITQAIRSISEHNYKVQQKSIDDAIKVLKTEVEGLTVAAKAKLVPLKQEYRILARQYTGPSRHIIGESEARFRFHPAFGNKIFPKEVVDFTEKTLGDKGSEWLRNTANATSLSRMLVASMDFSAPFIQGLVVLARNPIAWGKAVGRQYEFFINPNRLYQYMASPETMAVAAQRFQYGSSRATFEFFNALAPLQGAVGKIPGVGKGIAKGIGATYGRAEAAFTGFGEVARNEMWKALTRPGMSESELSAIARSLDRMTGVMSMSALGISRTQQDFENAFMFFAPRYTRAGLSFVNDVFKGGIAGNQARQGMASMMAAGTAMYMGAAKALDQQPNLNPESSRFLTLKIGNSYIGIGGIFYAIARLQAGVLATATGDTPANLLALDRMDNPFIKFMFNRTSPLTGGVVNILEQKDYFGEPFESPADWGKFIMEKVTPIAAQTTITEAMEGRLPNVRVFGAEMTGARTFPKSAFDLQREAKERLAQQEHGKSYKSLDKLAQNRINKTPEITKYQVEIDRTTALRGEATSVAFLNWKRERENAREDYIDALKGYQQAFDDGMLNGYDFKNLMQKESYGYGATLQHINSNPDYKNVFDELDKAKQSKEELQDLVYDQITEASYSGKFEDEYGIFKWDKYEEFIANLEAATPPDVWVRVIERQQESWNDLPPLAQEYKHAQQVLKPYWGIQTQVEKMFGKAYAESKRGQALIQKQRQRMRRNPDIAQAYNQFYARTSM